MPDQPSWWWWAQASLFSPHVQAQKNQLCLIQGAAVDKPSPWGLGHPALEE